MRVLCGFLPAMSAKAKKAKGKQIRAWHLKRRSGTDLSGIARASTPRSEAGSTTTGPSTAPSCTPLLCASMSISFDGQCRRSNDCGASQQRPGPGWMPSDSTSPASLPTGICSHAPTADLWGPDEARVSRPVLREREGEVPSRHSPKPHVPIERGGETGPLVGYCAPDYQCRGHNPCRSSSRFSTRRTRSPAY